MTKEFKKWPVRLLLTLAALFLLILIFDDKPWNLNLNAKAAAGESISLNDFIREGFWISSLVGFVVCLGMALTSRWWLHTIDHSQHRRFFPSNYTAWFWILLVFIVIAAGLIRYPRLSHSLWNDEEYSARRYILGYYQELENGDLRFREMNWKTTLFANKGANNHIINSVMGKISLKTWRRFADTSEKPFSETALRMPAYLAGLLGIGVVAALFASIGRPMLGLMAAFFLSIHPWHLRYSVEARGYAYLLLFTVLALFFLLKAVQQGRWKHWLLYALFQFLYMISFPGAVYFAAALNLCALGVIMLTQLDWQRRIAYGIRLIAANLFSAIAFLFIMGPSLRQIRMYLDRDIAQGEMGMPWLYDMWSHIVSGLRYSVSEPDFPLSLGLNMLLETQPMLKWLFFALIPGLILLGFLRAIRLGALTSLMVFPFFIAALLAWVHNTLTGNLLYTWYLVFLLPGLAMAIFFGVETPWSAIRKPATRNTLQAALGLVFLTLYFQATAQPRYLIRTHDRQPLRQIAYAMRSNPYILHEDHPVLTIALGTSCRQLGSYDPHIKGLDGKASENFQFLQQQMAKSDEKKYPLFVTYANAKRVQKENPEILKLLEDPERFEYIQTYYGLEEMFSFRLFRYLRSNTE